MTGIELISEERRRQVEKKGWSIEHDSQYTSCELVFAAICYAAPVKIYTQRNYANLISFKDPWPWSRGGRGVQPAGWDKRMAYGERKSNPGNVVPDPKTYTKKERVDLLIKAGALIAAEIDRLEVIQINKQK